MTSPSNTRTTFRTAQRSRRVRYRFIRFNFRFFATLMVLLAGMAIIVVAVHSVQNQRNAGHLLRLAREAAQSGELTQSVRFYTQYVSFEPNDTDALAELGLLLIERAASPEALLRVFAVLEDVLRKDPEREEVRRHIVDVCIALQRNRDALSHIEILLDDSSSDAELLLKQGACRESLSEFGEAAKVYLAGISAHEHQVDFYTRLAALVLNHGDEIHSAGLSWQQLDPASRTTQDLQDAGKGSIERAIANTLMETVAEKGRPPATALLAVAGYRESQGDSVAAAELLKRARSMMPEDPDILLAVAELSLRRAGDSQSAGKPAEASAFLEEGLEAAEAGLPTDDRFYAMLARIQIERGERQQAVELLTRGLRRLDETEVDLLSTEDAVRRTVLQSNVIFLLADLLISSRNTSPASDVTTNSQADKPQADLGTLLSRLKDQSWSRQAWKFLEGRMYQEREDWRNAVVALEQARLMTGNLFDLSQRIDLACSECYRRLGNPDARLASIRRSVVENRIWIPGRLAYAAALADAGRIDEAIDEYRSLLRYRGVAVDLARLMILRRLQLPVDRRDWSELEEVLAFAEQTFPESPDPLILRSEVLGQQEQWLAAESCLQSAMDRFSESAAVHAASVILSARRQDLSPDERTELTSRRLRDARERLGDQAELESAQLKVAVIRGGDNSGALVREVIERIPHYQRAEQYELLTSAAVAWQRMGMAAEELAVWNELAEAFPNDLPVRMTLAGLSRNSPEAWQECLSQVRRIEGPDGPNGNFEEGVHLIAQVRDGGHDRSVLQKARQLLTRAAEQRQGWAAVPRALGVLEEIAGDKAAAVARFREALALGDTSRDLVLKVLQSYYQEKRFTDADEELRNVVELQPDLISGDLARLAWRIAWHREQFDRAIELADKVATGDEDYRDYIWLAELRFARGMRGDDILTPLNKAVEVAPEAPQAWFALTAFLARVGRVDEAAAVIARAAESLPADVAQVTLGNCYELIDNFSMAEQQYLQMLQEKPDDVSRILTVADFYARHASPRAETYLGKLLDPKRNVPEFAVAWARRRQALIIASTGTYWDTARALELLSTPGGTTAMTVDDLLARARILSGRRLQSDRLAAIRLFEEASSRQTLQSSDLYRMAQTYEDTGNWSKTRELMSQLLARDPPDATHVAWHVRRLIVHGDLADATVWMQTLKSLEPGAFRTVLLQARLAAAEGDLSAARRQMESHFEQAGSALQSVRSLLDGDDPESVMSILRSYLGHRLDVAGRKTLIQASELISQNRREEAVRLLGDWLEKTQFADISRAAEQRVAAEVLEDVGDIVGAESLLQRAAGRSPTARLDLARFLGRHGRCGEALDQCAAVKDQIGPERTASAGVAIVSRGGVSPELLQRVSDIVAEQLQQRPDSPVCLL
ncbi:MAG: tetratricopeptide repeat protein, partial [Planctomycetaceae bacterium]|nr:tetratricopeptide repeat protein [Planctomycetaceae bacterium]